MLHPLITIAFSPVVRTLPDLSIWSIPRASSWRNLWSYIVSSKIHSSKFTRISKSDKCVPSSMYVGCLNVATWIRANRYLANSLSGTPKRACNRFFVSMNFSPYSYFIICTMFQEWLRHTGLTTNLIGTPYVRITSLWKWKTFITLSASSASNSSTGIS